MYNVACFVPLYLFGFSYILDVKTHFVVVVLELEHNFARGFCCCFVCLYTPGKPESKVEISETAWERRGGRKPIFFRLLLRPDTRH